MALRAQCSLIFEDEILYKGLIEPLKQQRSLSDVIIKCLSAYYYNQNIRCEIENTASGYEADDSSVDEFQRLMDDTQKVLAMQSALSERIQTVIEDGMDDVNDILGSINNYAKKHEYAKEEETNYGATLLTVRDEKLKEFDEIIQDEFNHIRSKIESGKAQDIADGVIDMGRLILTQIASIGGVQSSITASEKPVEVIENSEVQVPISETLLTDASEGYEFDEPDVKAEEEDNDASLALSDALANLLND